MNLSKISMIIGGQQSGTRCVIMGVSKLCSNLSTGHSQYKPLLVTISVMVGMTVQWDKHLLVTF